MFVCCIPNCKVKTKDAIMHHFPHPVKDPERFHAWLTFVGRDDLMAKDQLKVYKNHCICTFHFGEDQKFENYCNRSNLKRTAVPTIFSPNIQIVKKGLHKAPKKKCGTPQPSTSSTIDIVLDSSCTDKQLNMGMSCTPLSETSVQSEMNLDVSPKKSAPAITPKTYGLKACFSSNRSCKASAGRALSVTVKEHKLSACDRAVDGAEERVDAKASEAAECGKCGVEVATHATGLNENRSRVPSACRVQKCRFRIQPATFFSGLATMRPQTKKSDNLEKSKKKRIHLTIAQKLEFISKAKQGAPIKVLCDEYGIKKQTASQILKSESKLTEYAAKFSPDGHSNEKDTILACRKTMRPATEKDLDEAVYKWFKQQKSVGNTVTPEKIRQVCKEFGQLFNVKATASEGWLWRFRNRYGLRNGQVKAEAGTGDAESAELFCKQLSDIIENENILQHQLYNAAETGLFWRSLPQNKQAFNKQEDPQGRKLSMERLSVLCGANADGSHRNKLTVVGKSANTSALRSHMNKLSVHYYISKKAWLNAAILTDWFFEHFISEVQKFQEDVFKISPEDAKAILLLDNAPGHPNADELISANGKIKVIYLPSNTASLIQPMDQGVIKACKWRYKKKFPNEVKVMVQTNNEGQQALQCFKSYSMKSAICNFASVWNDLNTTTFVNSWKKLLHNDDVNTDFETLEAIDFLQVQMDAGEVTVKAEDVQTWLGVKDDHRSELMSIEEIAAEVLSKNQEMDSSEEDEPDVQPSVKRPKLSEVRKAIETLMQYTKGAQSEALTACYPTLRSIKKKIMTEQQKNKTN